MNPRLLPLLVLLLLAFRHPAAGQTAPRSFRIDDRDLTFEDVSSRVDVSFAAMRWNRARGVWQCEVILRNRDTRPLAGRLLLVVTETHGSSGPRETDNATPAPRDEPSFWNLTDWRDGQILASGQATRPRLISLGRQGEDAPRLTTRVYREITAPQTTPLVLTRTLESSGHPLTEVTVEELGPSGRRTLVTDRGAGFVTLGGAPGNYRWRFERENYLPAWRQAELTDGTSSLSFPRLTPRPGTPFAIVATGSVVNLSDDLTLQIRPGTSPVSGPVRATELPPQSPPYPFPSGWNPQRTLWLDWSLPLSRPLRLEARPRDTIPPGRDGAWVRFDTNDLAWIVVRRTTGSTDDRTEFETTEPGFFAWVVADGPPTTPPPPEPGRPLEAVPGFVGTPPDLEIDGRVVPPVSLASTNPVEVTAEATLTVRHPQATLPSGTALAVILDEHYRFDDGTVHRPPPYDAFVTLFRQPDDTDTHRSQARFPLSPLRRIAGTHLTEAVVEARVFVPEPTRAGSLGRAGDILRWEDLTFLARLGTLPGPRVVQVTPVDAANSGSTSTVAESPLTPLLGPTDESAGSSVVPAEILRAFTLTAGFSGPDERIDLRWESPPGDGHFVLARAWYRGSRAGLEPVARFAVRDGAWLPDPADPVDGLPGLDRSGQYALLRIPAPLGVVSGTVRDGDGKPVSGARVSLARQPWSAETDAEGRYRLLSRAGDDAVLAALPSGNQLARQSFTLPNSLRLEDLAVVTADTAPFVVAFSPPPGTSQASLLTAPEVRFSKPVVPAPSLPGLALWDPSSNPVPARVQFGLDGLTAKLIPDQTLSEGTEYRLRVASQNTDVDGRPLAGTLESRFTTLAATVQRSPGAQLHSEPPDPQGLVRIVGSAGMAPPRLPVLFVNDTTGQTTTRTANADGSFTNAVPAALTDRLRIVLIQPDGSRSEFPVGRQVFPDGSVALYGEGGRITNRNDAITVVVDVPPGAVLGRTRFKIEPRLPEELPTLTGNAPPLDATAFGAFDLAVEGDPVRGKLRVEVQVDRSSIQPPPGKTLADLTLFAASIGDLDDPGDVSEEKLRVYRYQSLLRPIERSASKAAPHAALFAGLFALVDPVGARVLLFGSVYYSQTEIFGNTASALFLGGRDEIPGTEVRVGGAVVRGRARSVLNPRPFSLQGGEVVVLSEADGTFVFLVPEQGASGGHALIATHPSFPRQFAGGAAVRTDPLYPNAATRVLFDRGRAPDDSPPSIGISHLPSLPPAGTDAVVRVEAVDDSGPAVVTVTVDHTDPPSVVASAVQRSPGLWDVRCSGRAKVVLRVRAVDSAGQAGEQVHAVLFGEPPVPPRPPNDPSGPYVVYSEPDEGAVGVAPLESITLHFNEWIDPQVLQTPATYFTLTPAAGTTFATFEGDPRRIRLSFGGLRDATEYTLTVQGLRDLNGQILDQNPHIDSPPAEPFRLRFRTAPNVRGVLSDIDEGGGAVLRGSYAYVIDRAGMSVNRYDVSIPAQPRLIDQRTLPGPPRALVLVRDYEFTFDFQAHGVPSQEPGPKRRSDLLVVAGKTSGAGFGYLRVFDLKDSFTEAPALGVANLSLDETSAFGRLVWSPPYLLLTENSLAAPQVHVLSLQGILLADAYRNLPPTDLLGLPPNSEPGVDANADGDFVDPGDKIPLVGRDAIHFVPGEVDVLSLNPNRPGPAGLYQLRDSSRFVTDVALEGRSGHAMVLTGPGRDVLVQIRGYPTETNLLVRPTSIRSYLIGQSSPDTLVPTVISNAFGLEFPGWYPKRGLFVNVDFQRLLLLNLVSLDNQTNSLRVIDASRPDSLVELGEIPLPVSEYGLLQGAEHDPSGRIVLSTAGSRSEDLIVLDPEKLLLPPPPNGPHPAILGRIGGVGTGVTPFAIGAQGITVGSLRARNWVGQGPPSIRFLPVGTPTADAVRLPDPEARLTALRQLPDPETLPVAGPSTNTALSPDSPAGVWYLLAEAPGGAGTQIQLAVMSLDPSGQIVAGTNRLLAGVAPDVVLRRLSNDPAREAFGAYLSEPLVLLSDATPESEIQRFAGRLRMLRAGSRIRVGIPDSMGGNPVLGPFAGTGTPTANLPPNAPPVRLGASQSRPVRVTTPTLAVDDPVVVRTSVDRLNGRACPGSAWLSFEHSLDAEITITVDGRPLRNVHDENGNLVAEFTDVPSVAGRHRLLVDTAMVPEPGDHPVEVRATRFANLAPTVALTARATVQHEIEIHQNFPIGHTVIQGVDLWDGHLVHSAQDAHVPGRKLALTFGRTYSSAGDSSDGPLGAGWTHSYNVRLVHRLACGVFTVVGGEGSGNAFTDPAPDPAKAQRYLPLLPAGTDSANLDFFTPQIGYHSVLVRDRRRPNEFWFFTKEALRHDFLAEPRFGTSSQQVYTLRAVREPNGNALSLDYLDGDADPTTLDSVTERDALGQLPKRAFRFEYGDVAGAARLRVLRGVNHQGSRDLLGLEIHYAYDDTGNLARVTRLGPTPETTRIEQYLYTAGDGPTGHNLVEYVGPNGAVTRYRYAAAALTPGDYYATQGRLLPGLPPHEIVTQVTHVGSARPGFEPTADLSFGFRYDFATSRRYVAEPRAADSDGNPVPETEYTLNPYGATVRIRAPLGQESEMRWATDHLDGSVLDESGRPVHDALLTWRRDPEGQEQFFEYHDGRGNLTRERTVFAGSTKRPVTDAQGRPVAEIVRSCAYDALFNQRTHVVDAEGNVTVHEIDPRNGNLLRTVDAEGHVTRFAYRPDGDLLERTDARGHTTAFLEYDPYGNPRRIRDPLGNETIATYDERGRPVETRDAFRHHTRTVHDSLDRVVVDMRLNDLATAAANPGAFTTNRYDAAGLLLESVGSLGLVTRNAYDALNRPVRSEQLAVRSSHGPPQTYVTRVAYDVAGNLISETDARGVVRRHAYDALNRRIRTSVSGPFGGPSNADGVLARLAYDRAGNLTNEVDLHGFAIRHVHDALYRIVESHLPFPNTVLATRYDREGNRVHVTDPDGFPTSFEYDRLHRLRRSVNAEGHVTEFAYDASGNRTNTVERISGRTTAVRFDAGNRETHRTLSGPGLPADGYSNLTTYDDASHTVIVTHPRGFRTQTRRDGLDRIVETLHDPGGLDLVTRLTHDPAGNTLTLTDPEGTAPDATFEYDQLGRVLRRTFVRTPDDVGDVTETVHYDEAGNVVATVDRRGIERRFEYDNLGRPLKSEIREPLSNGGAWRPLMTTTYDDAGNRLVQTDPSGRSITVEMDELGRVRRAVDSLGQIHLVENGRVDVLARTDRRGQRTTFAYDRLHRLRSQTEFDTNGVRRTSVSMEYLDAQRRVRSVDRRNRVTVAEHDALGRPVRLEREGPDLLARYGANPLLLERRDYDAHGNLVRHVDGNGHATEYVYDAADRPIEVVTGAGSTVAATTVTRYDRVGNVVSVKDGRPHGGPFDVRHTYDARYRRISTANALGETTRFRYDAGNHLIELTEPLGHATRYEYDELGALIAVDETPRAMGAAAGITRFRYDANGNLVAQQDSNGNLVTRAYDALNRLTNILQHTLPGTLSADVRRSGPFGGGSPLGWSFAYDANGNPSLTLDPRGQRIEGSFDHLNRLVQRTYSAHAETAPGGAPAEFQLLSLRFTYDGNGNLVEAIEEKQGSTSTFTERTVQEFDDLDRLVSKRRFDHDDPVGRLLAFEYDVAGNRVRLTDADARVTLTEFDPRNRLSVVRFDPASPGALQTTFEWEPDNRLRRIEYPGGTASLRAYDAADRLVALTNTTAGLAFPHSVFRYAYDANGNRTNQVEIQPGAAFGTEVTTYTYDALNRLLQVRYGTAGGLDTTYAPNGNRLTEKGTDPVTGLAVDRTYRYEQIAGRTATTFGGVNVLTRIDDHVDPARSIDYDYDLNLNQVARTQGTLRHRFRYDIRDQLVAADIAGQITRFDYDADRLRSKKVPDSGPETRYLYDQSSVLLEYGGASTAHATLRKYDYGHALLALGTPASATLLSRAFYLADGLGSSVNLVDPAGALLERYRYDAWGKVRTQQGSHDNPRLFTGHYRDTETGLHYFGARYYDDEQARFVSADPYHGDPANPPSLHRYLYAHANPLRFADPTGFAAESGDPTDRWIAETREMLREMDQRMEQDIDAQGPGALQAYHDGLKAAETLARMDEERQRMLQEAGLTEADLRNPVPADMARWQLARFKRGLEDFTVAGDGGTWRAYVAGGLYALAQVASAPFELGAATGTIAGKIDVGSEVTAGEWLGAAGDVLAVAGVSRLAQTVHKVGTTVLSKISSASTATRAARGAAIAEARRTLGREVAHATQLMDDAAKKLADDRQWKLLRNEMEESARLLAAERKAANLATIESQSVRRIDLNDARFRQLDIDEELQGSAFNVYSDGKSAFRVLQEDTIAFRYSAQTGGAYFEDFVRGHKVYDRLGLLEFRGQGKTVNHRPFVEMQLHDGFHFPKAGEHGLHELSYLDQHRHQVIQDTLADLWKRSGRIESRFELQWGMNRNGDLAIIDPPQFTAEEFARVDKRIDELARTGRLSPTGRFRWIK